MTIQEWGAIGEIIGGVAVVASLVYLAMQIRQNTRQLALSIEATRLAAFERNVEAGNQIRDLFIKYPDVAELYARGVRNFRQLNDSERLRFGMILRNVFSSMQGAHVRHLTYGNDPAGFDGAKRMLDDLVRLPGVRDWLNRNEPDWRPEFAALVAERLQLTANEEMHAPADDAAGDVRTP